MQKTIKDVFKTNSSKTPVVYLYLVGPAKDLLKGDFQESDLLCKYGCTDDIERRCSEHDKKFTKDFNRKIELVCFSIIDAKYIFEAESNITHYFKSNLIEYLLKHSSRSYQHDALHRVEYKNSKELISH